MHLCFQRPNDDCMMLGLKPTSSPKLRDIVHSLQNKFIHADSLIPVAVLVQQFLIVAIILDCQDTFCGRKRNKALGKATLSLTLKASTRYCTSLDMKLCLWAA